MSNEHEWTKNVAQGIADGGKRAQKAFDNQVVRGDNMHYVVAFRTVIR